MIGPNEAPNTGDTVRTVSDAYPPASQGRAGLGGGCAGAAAIVVALLLGGVLMLLAVVLLGGRLLGSLMPSVPSPSLSLALPTPAPTPTPRIITSAAVVQQLQGLSRLETAAYTVQTVVTVERPGNVLGIGRQRVLVVVYGQVVAGIDLRKLRPQDVTVADGGKRVTIRLPEAEVLSAHLDESRTQLYDHQTGIFTRPDTNLVVEAQKAGAEQVLQAACRDGIMQRATEDGQQALRQMLGLVGVERIDFETGPVPACVAPNRATPTAAATPRA